MVFYVMVEDVRVGDVAVKEQVIDSGGNGLFWLGISLWCFSFLSLVVVVVIAREVNMNVAMEVIVGVFVERWRT